MKDTDPYPGVLRAVGEFGIIAFRPGEFVCRTGLVFRCVSLTGK